MCVITHLVLIAPFVTPDGRRDHDLLPCDPVDFLLKTQLLVTGRSRSCQPRPSWAEQLPVQIENALRLNEDAVAKHPLFRSGMEHDRQLRIIATRRSPGAQLPGDVENSDVKSDRLIGKDNLMQRQRCIHHKSSSEQEANWHHHPLTRIILMTS